MGFLNFFRNDFSKILGIYFDGDKIFLAYLASEIEFSEINFSGDTNQLAEKIAYLCAKNDWENVKVALALPKGAAVTFQSDFKNVPASEVSDAVKIWAIAHAGKDSRYSFVKRGNEVWMEALPESLIEEYDAAFEKNSLQLCALTEIPDNPQHQLTPYNRAESAAEIALNDATPNFLTEKISLWNFKRIALAAAAVFLLAISLVSAKLTHEYFSAVAQVESARGNLSAFNEVAAFKEIIDADAIEMRRLNEFSATQNVTAEKFNALVKIGRQVDGKVWLDKVKASNNTIELVGAADTSDALRNYLSRLKSFAQNIKLENSSVNDGQIDFLIQIIF